MMLAAPSAFADTSGGTETTAPKADPNKTGGAEFGTKPPKSSPKQPTVAGFKAKIKNGLAYAPAEAPAPVKRAIWAGNKIRKKRYRYGGGHASFSSRGYDCSGAVSFALHGGGLLDSPLDSSSFMKWGERGVGQWITVYTNPGHAYVVIAGIRFDTSSAGDARRQGSGPRWRKVLRDTGGFKARHPEGL
jgi:hypothetical protein